MPKAVGEGSVFDKRSSNEWQSAKSCEKLPLTCSYAGHVIVTCSSSSMAFVLQNLHTLSLAFIFSHPPVSIFSICDLVRMIEIALLALYGMGVRVCTWATGF